MLCLGESAAMSGEAASRTDLGLPGRQRALAEAILALGKPVVVTLSSGRPLTAPWLFERADAVLATWFLGQEAGHAVADVLTGKFNPTGRLPVSWPRDVGQVPIFYNELPAGRPYAPGVHYSSTYLDLPPTPQFPFGHGLSYSRFALSDLRCKPTRVKAGDTVEVSLAVHNESRGGRRGDAVPVRARSRRERRSAVVGAQGGAEGRSRGRRAQGGDAGGFRSRICHSLVRSFEPRAGARAVRDPCRPKRRSRRPCELRDRTWRSEPSRRRFLSAKSERITSPLECHFNRLLRRSQRPLAPRRPCSLRRRGTQVGLPDAPLGAALAMTRILAAILALTQSHYHSPIFSKWQDIYFNF